MKIDDSFSASSDLRSTQVGRTPEVQQQQEARQKQTESRDDSVNLSPLGAELARAIANDPPDVVNRIEQIEQAVNSGTFTVSSEEVAQSLVESALQDTQFENAQAANTAAPPSI